MNEFQELSIYSSVAIILIAYLFFQDSGDDDDEGGGLMQPVYLGSRN
ncbi:hypothetical protein [Prochlorococcus marinus]|nr:hypothetical protein [Prochlorococcus marinus]